MPTMVMCPFGRTTARASVRLASLPTQSITWSAPPVRRMMSPSPRAMEPLARRTARAISPGSTTWWAPRRRARAFWVGCLATARIVQGRPNWARAAMVNRPRAPAPSTTTRSPRAHVGGQGPVHGTRGGLDHHRGLVAPVVGDGVELAGVSHHAGRPAPAGVAAEPGLQAGLDGAEGDALAAAEVATGARRADGVDAPGHAAQHRFHHDPTGGDGVGSLDHVGHHLVAGHEGNETMGSK